MRFYATPAEARRGRAKTSVNAVFPDRQSAEEACVLAAIAAIRDEGSMTLDALADLTGYAPTHFQRLFKRTVGLSPAAFARALPRGAAARRLEPRAGGLPKHSKHAGYCGPQTGLPRR